MIDTAPLRRKLLDLAITGKLVPKQGEWRTVKLEDVCSLIADCPHTTAPDEGAGFPLIRTPNVGFGKLELGGVHRVSKLVYETRILRGKPEAGDLIFAREAPAGNVAVIGEGEQVCLGQRTVLFKPIRTIVDSKFLVYYILSPTVQKQLVSQATGSTVAHVNLGSIRPFQVRVPSLAEQKAIVRRLEELLKLEGEIAAESAALDDLITAAKRKILSLAISGRLVPRQGEWKSVKLGEMCEVINGLWKGVKKPFVNVGVIRAANFTKDCKLNLEKTVYIDVEAGKYETRKLQEDDLIVERSGGGPGLPVGRVVLFPKVDGEYSISNFTSILRITDWRTVNPKYLHMALVTIYNTGYTEKIQTQTTNLHNLNFKEYLNIPIPLPSLAEQKAIVARVEELFNVLDGAVPR